jgi:hypothetical protein
MEEGLMKLLFRSRRLGIGVAAAAMLGTVLVANPAMASDDGSWIAVSDAAGIQVAITTNGSSSWKIETVASGAEYSWSSPSLVEQPESGDMMVTAVRGDGSLWFFWQAPGSNSWNAQEVAGANSAEYYSQPALVAENTGTVDPAYEMIVAQDQNDLGSHFYWQKWGTNSWSNEQLPTSTGIAKQPDIALTDSDTAVVAFIDSQGSGTTSFAVDELPYNMSGWNDVHVGTSIDSGGLMDISVVVQPNTGNLLVGGAGDSGDSYFFWSPSLTSWNQENIQSGDPDQNYGTYIQPLSITGNEDGVAEGIPNDAGTCDWAVTQQNGPNPWVSHFIDCPGGYPTVPVLQVQPATFNEVGAALQGDGDAYYYWQVSGSSTWNHETISGISDVHYYTMPSIYAD